MKTLQLSCRMSSNLALCGVPEFWSVPEQFSESSKATSSRSESNFEFFNSPVSQDAASGAV